MKQEGSASKVEPSLISGGANTRVSQADPFNDGRAWMDSATSDMCHYAKKERYDILTPTLIVEERSQCPRDGCPQRTKTRR